MTVAAEKLAVEIAELRRRLAALERSGQLSSSSVRVAGVDMLVPAAISVSMNGAATAQQVAELAEATAQAKNSVFFQPIAPEGERKDFDVWFDTDNGNRIHRWTNGGWEARPLDTAAFAANSVTAETIDVETLTGVVITGAVLRTGSDNARVELDATGLKGYDNLGVVKTHVGTDGRLLAEDVVLKGVISTTSGDIGARLEQGGIYFDRVIGGIPVISSLDMGQNPINGQPFLTIQVDQITGPMQGDLAAVDIGPLEIQLRAGAHPVNVSLYTANAAFRNVHALDVFGERLFVGRITPSAEALSTVPWLLIEGNGINFVQANTPVNGDTPSITNTAGELSIQADRLSLRAAQSISGQVNGLPAFSFDGVGGIIQGKTTLGALEVSGQSKLVGDVIASGGVRSQTATVAGAATVGGALEVTGKIAAAGAIESASGTVTGISTVGTLKSNKILNTNNGVSAPYAMASGSRVASMGIAAGTSVNWAITFPVGRFTSPPNLALTCGNARFTLGYSSLTKDGALISTANWSTGAGNPDSITWTAVQMTAAGSNG